MRLALSLSLALTLFCLEARACPFCEAQQPTLAQRRAAAAVFALSDVLQVEGKQATFRLQKIYQGAGKKLGQAPLEAGSELTLPAPAEARQGDLYLLVANEGSAEPSGGKPATFEWSFERLDETAFAYVARAPAANAPAAERLKYFVRYLEDPSAVVAADAYLEFAHAPLADVAGAIAEFPSEKLRGWLVDPQVPDRRKGLYGLLLGLLARQPGRDEDQQFLKGLVERPRDDFRAGYDGILGGYLWAAGEPGLELIERKLLADPKAADGDVRHAVSALRFYWEHGRQIPAEKLRAAMRLLLARPEFARAAIIDLARWKDWEALDKIAGLYQNPAYAEVGTKRAIIGFLLTCPEPAAVDELAKLRKLDPAQVSETERQFALTGGVR